MAAIVCFAAALALVALVFARHFWVGVSALACVLLAIGAAWYGVRRRGAALIAGLGAAVLLLAASVLITQQHGLLLEGVAAPAALVVSILCARAAFLVHVALPEAEAPRRAVLFFNPKSGGGKAERFNLGAEARARGIEPVELQRGDDLAELVAAAIERGADALAMAGGDGSQALVAAAAAEHDLPYACIPAGTRNHFALDLGVDREDVVGALDAFVDGGERRVDLAEVNGTVFVNNVSLGLYAEAVQRAGYREAKLRTILDTMPDVLGPGGDGLDLRWSSPGGREHASGAVVLVSNNRYRLGRPLGSGTRPKIDDGELGIAVMSVPGGPQEAGPAPADPLGGVVRAPLRGRLRRHGPRRDRRRGGPARPAASLLDPPAGAQGPDRPCPSRRLALGEGAGTPRPGARRPAANRRRPRPPAPSARLGALLARNVQFGGRWPTRSGVQATVTRAIVVSDW